MKMKTIVKIMVAAVLMALPLSGMAQVREKVPYTLAKNYFLRNDAQITTKKITSQKDFDRHFGAAAVMGKDGAPTKIDFTRQFVIALAGQPTNHMTTYDVTEVAVEDGVLNVEYMTNVGEETLTYYMKPMVLLILDIDYARMGVMYTRVFPTTE